MNDIPVGLHSALPGRHPARVMYDTLRNFVTGLGTGKDPRVSSHWHFHELDRNVLENAYRSDWLARRLVDLPAYDRAREWRTWEATGKQIQAIDRLEKRLFVQNKTMQAEQRARLYGGGAMVLGVDVGEPEDELDPDDVGKDDLKFIAVLNRYELAAGPRIYNVLSPYYTRPEYYTVATPMFGFYGEQGGAFPQNPLPVQQNLVLPPRQPQGGSPLLSDPMRQMTPSYGMIRIHPSRVIEFAGNPLPDWRLAPMGGGWGDSVLQTMDDSLRDFAMIMGGLASVINDMKLDIVSVPELSRHLGTDDNTAKFLERWTMANTAKSTINTLLIDENEKWQRIQTSFGSTPDLIRVAMQVACASGGVPMSRVMGMSPNTGLGTEGGGSGEVDLHAYYDDQRNVQKTDNRRIMYMLDRVIVASAIGSNDEDVDYQWNPLYKENPAEQADVALKKAQTTQIYVGLSLINEDALREGVVSQLTQDGTYPALEQAIDDYGAEPEEPEQPPTQMLPTPPPGMVNKGHFEANPFAMLRAQQAAKSGQPIRVPPHPSNRPPIPAPGQFKAKDADDEPRDEIGRWTKVGGDPRGAMAVAMPSIFGGWEPRHSGTRELIRGHKWNQGDIPGRFKTAEKAEEFGNRELRRAEREIRDFDPDEPRDQGGKWTAGEAGEATADQIHGWLIKKDQLSKKLGEAVMYRYDHAGQSMPGVDVKATRAGYDHLYELTEAARRAEDRSPYDEAYTRYRVEQTPLPTDAPTIFYHGTASDAAKRILREGLKPHGSAGADQWALKHHQAVGHFELGGRAQSVYMSSDPDMAYDFGELAQEVHPRSSIALLKVTIPAEAKAKVHYDEMFSDDPKRPNSEAFRFEGAIPKEWISVVKGFKHDPSKGIAVRDAAGDLTFYVAVLGDEPETGLADFDPGQKRIPKGEAFGGRWTKEESGASGGHPGHGYSQRSSLDKFGVIHTDNPEDALRALYEGRKVELDQPREVATLLDRLGAVSARMIKMGAQAKNFDLCKVSVAGTNLFCAKSYGIPRLQMPQIPADKNAAFQEWLQKVKGVKVTDETEKAEYLRATQDQLDGAKVAGIAHAMATADPAGLRQPIFVSKDNYILDGHHRWAGRVGLDVMSGKLGTVSVNIHRVDMGIIPLLKAADEFMGGGGHVGVPGESAAVQPGMAAAEAIGKGAVERIVAKSLAAEAAKRQAAAAKRQAAIEKATAIEKAVSAAAAKSAAEFKTVAPPAGLSEANKQIWAEGLKSMTAEAERRAAEGVKVPGESDLSRAEWAQLAGVSAKKPGVDDPLARRMDDYRAAKADVASVIAHMTKFMRGKSTRHEIAAVAQRFALVHGAGTGIEIATDTLAEATQESLNHIAEHYAAAAGLSIGGAIGGPVGFFVGGAIGYGVGYVAEKSGLTGEQAHHLLTAAVVRLAAKRATDNAIMTHQIKPEDAARLRALAHALSPTWREGTEEGRARLRTAEALARMGMGDMAPEDDPVLMLLDRMRDGLMRWSPDWQAQYEAARARAGIGRDGE